MFESINEHLKNDFYFNPTIRDMIVPMANAVVDGQMTSFIAANKLIDTYYKIKK